VIIRSCTSIIGDMRNASLVTPLHLVYNDDAIFKLQPLKVEFFSFALIKTCK